MRARALIVVLALSLPLSLNAAAQSVPGAASSYPVIQGKTYKFEKVADGVYYASGGVGSNNIVIVNERDVLLVDDGTTPATARALLADMKLITDKPIRYVVNTHFHYDHTNGNSIFPPDVDIIGHEYIREVMTTTNVYETEPYKTSQGIRAPAQIESLKKRIGEEKDAARKSVLEKELSEAQTFAEQLKEAKVTPPTVTYSSKMVLQRGQREIQLLFLGRAHTAGDTVVYLPKERIVCTGDLMQNRIAYMGNGFFDEWIETLDELKKLDFKLILPGHGSPFTDKGLIAAFQDYLVDLANQAATLQKQGVSADEAALRVDLTAHRKFFPAIEGPGADVRSVRRLYEWIKERGDRPVERPWVR